MNKLTSNKKRIVSYLRATSNEIRLDVLHYKILNIEPEQTGYFPRPTKRRKLDNYLLNKVFKFLWIHILGYVLFTAQLFMCLYRKSKIEKNSIRLNKKSLGLAFSSKSWEVIKKENCGKEPDCWITLPFSKDVVGDRMKVVINILNLVTYEDLWNAYLLAINTHRKMSSLINYRKWVLNSYTAFEWFTVRLGIEKIEGDFYIANHFDRWIVMMDFILGEHHRIDVKSKLTLVQHGLVGDIANEKCDLPYRISMLSKLCTYDKVSEMYFKDNILDNRLLMLEEVNYFRNVIALTEVHDYIKTNILFVGHSICLDLHIYLYTKLKEKKDFIAYYKPHPTEKKSRKVINQSWEIIDDIFSYPKVDFLISYNSTLGIEYENLGTKVFFHSINADVNSQSLFLSQLENEIEQCNRKKSNLETV